MVCLKNVGDFLKEKWLKTKGKSGFETQNILDKKCLRRTKIEEKMYQSQPNLV